MTKKADCQPGNLVLTLPNCVNAKVGVLAQALILINEATLAKTLEPTRLYFHSCMYAMISLWASRNQCQYLGAKVLLLLNIDSLPFHRDPAPILHLERLIVVV